MAIGMDGATAKAELAAVKQTWGSRKKHVHGAEEKAVRETYQLALSWC